MPAFLKCKTCFLRENMGCFKGIPQHTFSQINFQSKIISFEIFGVCVALNMFDVLRNLVIILVLMILLSYQSGIVLANNGNKCNLLGSISYLKYQLFLILWNFIFVGFLFSWLEIFETGSYYVAQVTLEPTI